MAFRGRAPVSEPAFRQDDGLPETGELSTLQAIIGGDGISVASKMGAEST